MSELAMPSTGDYERDQEDLRRFAENDELIKRGECPNECGKMQSGPPNRQRCESCGFIHTVHQIHVPISAIAPHDDRPS